MPRLCFVPGCKTGTYEARKKNREAGLKNPSLFKPPNTVILDKWNEVIPGKDREMEMKDRICEMHFEEKYINSYFEEKLLDGSLFRLKRTINNIQRDAVPTIFPVSSNWNKFNLTYRSSRENIDMDDERIMEVCSQNIKVENVDESDAINPLRFDNLVFDFEYLVKNLHDIQKPSSSWTVSFICETDSKYVMCAVWRNYLVEKRVVIDTSLNIKVFLSDKLVDSKNNKVNCIDDISELLEKINHYDPCLGIDKGTENCLKYFDRRFKKNGRPNNWCSECRPQRKAIRKKMRSPSDKGELEKRCENYALLAKRFDLIRQQNYRLTKRVHRLSTRLKYFQEYDDSF